MKFDKIVKDLRAKVRPDEANVTIHNVKMTMNVTDLVAFLVFQNVIKDAKKMKK